ncbi:MAG TPA: CocE/NonD family hydrolase [Gaiellaceae bacterium]|nr:CocE/NonD family hydrolase [Gaiellaceae bacterium]
MTLGRETLVFRCAVAVLLAHVVTDAFVLLEPGASRREHVAWAAVALVGGGLAAWRYPRLRPGLRATLALVLGALALVAGGIAAVHAAGPGPEGDDWTGLLLLPAGAALVLLGAAVLWRSRKRTGRVWLRRALVAVGAVLAVYWILLPVAIAYVATHNPRAAVEPADLGRPYEEVALETSDGLRLAGWYVPSENGAAVLVFPGRSGTVEEARMLAEHGYGVLLVDRRGQGESDGDPNAFGWGGTEDVAAAIAWLEDRPDVEEGRIGGLGLSVGGELLLQSAAEGIPLGAVVSEGAGTRSLREDLIRGPAGWPSLPTAATLTAATAVFSWDAPPPSLEELVGRIAPTPILLVYAGHGQGGEDLTPEYFAAAAEPKELWEIPEAGHTGGLDARPREYEERVVGFLDEALLGGG